VKTPSLAEIASWGATVDVAQGGRAFGLSKSFSYDLLARGEFPARALKVGGRWRIVTASIVKALSAETP
jgi:predicted DNA-binding transcriptional regulator AlpA